ncbi:MAG TPA: porin family protein [Bacteroidales bacterium]|nr:porin family protein [Bacteroidales bacterium]
MKIPKMGISWQLPLLLLVFLMEVPAGITYAQKSIGFGIHADPVIGWFTSDNKDVINEGARPGFNFGLTFNRYFTENYAFSTGVSLITSGGKLVYNDTISLLLNSSTTVVPGNGIIYNIKYLAVPIGLKLKTNQIGYVTFFSDLGIDPKFVLGGKAEIPSLQIEKEDASAELKNVSLGYHVTAGIEYSLGGTTALVLGLNFDSNFVDITQDKGDQPLDKILHKMLGFRLGINF